MSSSSTARMATATYTVSGTIGAAVTAVYTIPTPAPSKAPETSILAPPHTSPTVPNPADPLVLFIIQACIIIVMSRALSYILARIRQPRVIGDIITGLLLGPSVMGRIPNFTYDIFPSASIPYLTLVANLGLVLFLFIVGVETDLGIIRKNARTAGVISAVGIIFPFSIGCALSVGIYNHFVNSDTVQFGHFLLFIGTAESITAFPVLARILTELRLLQDHVGVSVLAAGVGNDVVGWILLALAVVLVNSGSGITAFYVLLICVGLILVLFVIVKPLLFRLVRHTGGFETGPTQGMMILVLVLILTCAFITDIIGVHPIFGGFLVGLIMPRDPRFARGLIEKLEDLVTVLFIPIYFALSGLKTNLGLLNDGTIWGWTILVIFVAFASKFLFCALAAKFCSFTNRESLAVGALMSCKGLVELIVLNIGLQAGILNNQVFAMFVLAALVTTFTATPLTLWFYPISYRQQRAAARHAEMLANQPHPEKQHVSGDDVHIRSRFAVVLDRLDHLPSTMAFIKLLQPLPHWAKPQLSVDESTASGEKVDHDTVSKASGSTDTSATSQVAVDALRLIELTERFTTVLRASDTSVEARYDPLTNILRTFAGLNSIALNTELSIVSQEMFARAVVEHAAAHNADLLMVPWAGATASDERITDAIATVTGGANPLDGIFGRSAPALEQSPHYAAFVRNIFLEAPCDVGLFLDRSATIGSAAMAAGRQHIFFAFHGGPDDRAALHFVVQLCRHPGITAEIIRIVRDESGDECGSLHKELTGTASIETAPPAHFTISPHGGGISGADTIYATQGTQHQLQSETADDLALCAYFDVSSVHPPVTRSALKRVTYSVVRTAKPLLSTLQHAQQAAAVASPHPLLAVAGRGRRAAASHTSELASVLRDVATGPAGQQALGLAASSEVRKTLGDIGSALVAKGSSIAGSLLVIQAGLPAASLPERKDV